MFKGVFWRDALERALATAAEAFGAVAGVDAVFNVAQFDWMTALGVAAGAGVLALVKSIAAARVNGTVSPASLAQVPTKF